jgi:hypothetical protein
MKIPEGENQRYQHQRQGQLSPRDMGGRLIGGLGGVPGGIFLIFVAAKSIFIAPAMFAAVFTAKLVGAGVIIAAIVRVGGSVDVGAVAWLGRADGGGFCGLRSNIRLDGRLRELALPLSGEIVGHGFLFVEPDLPGVGADETLIEDATGKLVEVFVFEGAQHAGADLRGVGDGIQLDAALLALFAKFFSEGAHVWLRRAAKVSVRIATQSS